MWLLIVICIAKTNCSSDFPAAYSYYTLMFLHIGEGGGSRISQRVEIDFEGAFIS